MSFLAEPDLRKVLVVHMFLVLLKVHFLHMELVYISFGSMNATFLIATACIVKENLADILQHFWHLPKAE